MEPLWHDCPVGNDCPQLDDYGPAEVIVQGDKLNLRDPDRHRARRMPAREDAVVVPRAMLRPEAIPLSGLGDWIAARFTTDLVRVENRRAYASASDGGDFARYLAGDEEPTAGEAWFQQLRAEHASGMTRRKIHITAGSHLSDYERYACEWGFARTVAAGEHVRMLDDADGIAADLPDFLIADHRHVLRMDYDDTDKFLAAYPISGPDTAAYRVLADTLWPASEDFTTWWDRHPEAHRPRRAA